MSSKFSPGDHGGDGARLAESLGLAVEEVLDLSASLNPVAPNFEPLLRGHLGALRRYPQPDRATTALASRLGVDPDLVVLTNGGAEAIALLAAENPVGWVRDPEFSLYRRHLRDVIPGAPRWRSNPHNPSGLLAAPEATSEVWDEAFWALATGTWTRGDVERGCIVVGSLTKLLACPGLRIGYVVCPDHDLAARIRLRQPAWSLNGLVAAALPDMLGEVRLAEWAAATAELRQALRGLLVSAGFTPEPSDANWLLVRAPGLRDRLAEAAVSVRDCANFAMPGYVRIAVPDRRGLERLAQALGRTAK